MHRQLGMIMIFALVVLLAMTLLGVAAMTSGILQEAMAHHSQRQSVAFNAAEAALSGVVFESEDEVLLRNDSLLDPISEARQGAALAAHSDALTCLTDHSFVERTVTHHGFSVGTRHISTGMQDSQARARSWSRTAFVREQACRGSSNVIGNSNIRCHVFMVRGCGQLTEHGFAVANTLTVSVFAPASQ